MLPLRAPGHCSGGVRVAAFFRGRTLRVGSLLILGLFGGLSAPAPAGDTALRVRIPAASITHEIGACYIAGMNFGEDGDKETRNRSSLVLFEDGRPLGPAHALHQDIREKGKGRYSHWTRGILYFSTSDNSDPTRNGRTYEVGSTSPDSTLGGLRRLADPPRKHVEVVRSSHHAYTIRMGGFLDAENTRTRSHAGMEIVFQPNISLTIANTGDTVVRNPKLIANERGDWGNASSMVAEFARGARTPGETALFIWQSARCARYHSWPLFGGNEFHDPVKLFNSYGFALCDDASACTARLWKQAGLGKPYGPDPIQRHLRGHVQAEVAIDGEYQFLDVDQDVFFLDRENRRPVSGNACARDHDLVRREVCYGPVFGGWRSSETNAALFGADDGTGGLAPFGHTMSYSLRPGEKVVFRWDNVGKWACEKEEYNRRPPFFGNSRFVYRPPLAPDRYREGVEAAKYIVPGDLPGAALAGAGPGAFLMYRFDVPWVICGARIQASFVGRGPEDRFALDVVLDPETRTRVWEGAGPGQVTADVTIDKALQPHKAPAKYGYRVVVTLLSADDRHGAQLRKLTFETDVMTAPLSLPRLRLGENRFVFTAVPGKSQSEITLTHVWRECRRVRPPASPAQALSPVPGSEVRSTFVPFRWKAVKGCRTYHIQVSARRDFRVPWRPSYDVILRAPEWCVPYRGMFSPEVTYYWRVRARSARGIWSAWSSVWPFRWNGPCVPLHVREEFTDSGILLRWDPNPRGNRPVAYDVYGSDEKGFSVHKGPYKALGRGRVPANFLARTAETSLLVVKSDPAHPNQNKCYYRVVAVDAQGVESVPSAFVEMPHPHIWTVPPRQTAVGKPFHYRLGTIRSLGDVQYRYETPHHVYNAREDPAYELAAGPSWLRIDPSTGVLSGTPPLPGRFAVRVRVRTRFGRSAEQAFTLEAVRAGNQAAPGPGRKPNAEAQTR